MHVDTGEVRCGTSVLPHPSRILVQDMDGGSHGEILWGSIPRFWGGGTQGDPIYPTIFNVVVDTVVRHWISLVSGGVGGQYGWVR